MLATILSIWIYEKGMLLLRITNRDVSFSMVMVKWCLYDVYKFVCVRMHNFVNEPFPETVSLWCVCICLRSNVILPWKHSLKFGSSTSISFTRATSSGPAQTGSSVGTEDAFIQGHMRTQHRALIVADQWIVIFFIRIPIMSESLYVLHLYLINGYIYIYVDKELKLKHDMTNL